MNAFVSIVIPCYNQAQFLDEALQSVFNQTYPNWECIIVNDGSLDHTEEVVKKWAIKDSRFIYLYKENGGLSSARNAGIEVAGGEFILTLDSDDKYEKTFIYKALEIILSNNQIGIVSSWGMRFKGIKQYDEFRPRGGSLKDFLFYNSAIGTSFFRKKCWEEAGRYDENMKLGYEDWEFYIRVCKFGWNVHVIEEVLFFYQQHESSMRSVAVNEHDKNIKKYIFIKHKDLYLEHYECFVDYLLENINFLKKENIKIKSKIDFKLGSIILKPIRTIKKYFK